MTTPHGPTGGRLRLRTALRGAREAARLTQQEVADAMDWSLSKIIRIEKGTVSVSTNDVRALVQLYGMTQRQQVTELLELARTSRRKAWWTQYRNAIPAHYAAYVGLEAEASALKYFQPIVMPGLLQTRAYANTVFTNTAPGKLPPDIVEARTTIRMTRQQEVLGRADPPTLEIVLDEAVIRRVAGSVEIMREQLLHLVAMGAARHITIQLLPFTAGVNTVEGAFAILQFPDPDDTDIIYIEGPLTGAVLDRPSDAGPYRRAFERLQEVALSRADSLAFIARVAGELS